MIHRTTTQLEPRAFMVALAVVTVFWRYLSKIGANNQICPGFWFYPVYELASQHYLI
jgi:hypothetical protein